MDIMTLIQAVPGVGPYLPYVLVGFGVCAVVAAQLPPPQRSGTPYDVIYRVVNLLGQNYNQARNANARPPSAGTGMTPPAIALTLFVALALALGLAA